MAIGFGLYALNTESYAGLCVASVFTGLGYGLGGMICSTMLIGRWFETNVATVAGIAAVGSGVAAVVLPPIVVAVVNATSLSAAICPGGRLGVVAGTFGIRIAAQFSGGYGFETLCFKKSRKGHGQAEARSREQECAPFVFAGTDGCHGICGLRKCGW